MATLLDAVNNTLNRVQVLDSGNALDSLTTSSHQNDVDTTVQIWNELVDELYSSGPVPRPNNMSENAITLIEGTREYALESDLVRLLFPLHDRTNGHYITEFPGGYTELITGQLEPDSFEGLPLSAAIRPDDSKLYLDRIPGSDEDGRVYTYIYAKDGALENADDIFPFTDAVFRALVPAAAELWKFQRKNQFAAGVFRHAMGRAARILNRTWPRESWRPRRLGLNPLDPYTHA